MSKVAKRILASVLLTSVINLSGYVLAEPIPKGWQAWNMEPIGFLDYQDRYSGKLTIKESNGRWYLYQAYSKTSDGKPPAIVITDVTDC